jgi:hypothetical protein
VDTCQYGKISLSPTTAHGANKKTPTRHSEIPGEGCPKEETGGIVNIQSRFSSLDVQPTFIHRHPLEKVEIKLQVGPVFIIMRTTTKLTIQYYVTKKRVF